MRDALISSCSYEFDPKLWGGVSDTVRGSRKLTAKRVSELACVSQFLSVDCIAIGVRDKCQ